MKKRVFLMISLLSVSSLFAQTVANKRVESSPNVEWRNIGPGMSGYNETMIIHPSDDNVMFLGPDMRVSYGTWDKGKTWHTIKDSDGTGRDLEWLLDIEFSRQNPDYGIAISFQTPLTCQVLETKDRGRSWEVVSSAGKVHRELVIHPENDKIIYIGAGDFWNVKDNHRTQSKIGGKISPRAEYGHVLKSTNGGKTFKKLATNISQELSVGRIIFNEKSPDNMIMATSHGVFASQDGGENWTSASQGLSINHPRDMTSVYDKARGKQTLFLVEQSTYEPSGKTIKSSGGVFRSDDFGATWHNITGDLGIDLSKVKSAFTKQSYFKTISRWLGVPQKQAESQYSQLPTQAMPTWNRIAVNPLNADEIYLMHNKKHDVSFGDGEVWKTDNGGKTWFPCARNGKYWFEGNDKQYWATKGITSSMNMTFSHVQGEMERDPERYGARHLNINSQGEVYIGDTQQTLVSKNGGKTWEHIDDIELKPGSKQWIGRGNSNLPGRFMLTETGVKGRKLFCSGEHGLWQTVSLGDYPDKEAVAFEQIEGQIRHNAALSVSTVAVHPKDPNTIYILMWRQNHRGTLRRTTDGGKTWENISTIHQASNSVHQGLTPQASLLIDPENPNNMYFVAIRKSIQEVGQSPNPKILTKGEYGIYRSTDAGYTWAIVKKGLPAMHSVNRLTLDPKNPRRIYASLNQINEKDLTAGLYVSEDGAQSFKKVNSTPKAVTSVNDLHIAKNGDMYISCGTRNGKPQGGGVYRSTNGGKSWSKIFDAPYVWHTTTSSLNPDMVLSYVKGKSGKLSPEDYATNKAQEWEMFDAGIACQTFCLAAHNYGVGTCIFGIIDDEAISNIVSLPEDETVAALITFGYPDEKPNATPRHSVEQIARYI